MGLLACVSVWSLRVILLAAALTRPSLASTAYLTLALLSLCAHPMVTSPLAALATRWRLQLLVWALATAVSLAMCMAHALQRGAGVIPEPSIPAAMDPAAAAWLRVLGLSGAGELGSLQSLQLVGIDALVLGLCVVGMISLAIIGRCTNKALSAVEGGKVDHSTQGWDLPDSVVETAAAGVNRVTAHGSMLPPGGIASLEPMEPATSHIGHSDLSTIPAAIGVLSLAVVAAAEQSALGAPILLVLVWRLLRWSLTPAKSWAIPRLLQSVRVAVPLAAYCATVAVAWHASTAILSTIGGQGGSGPAPLWVAEFERTTSSLGAVRLPAGGGSAGFSIQFAGLILSFVFMSAVAQDKHHAGDASLSAATTEAAAQVGTAIGGRSTHARTGAFGAAGMSPRWGHAGRSDAALPGPVTSTVAAPGLCDPPVHGLEMRQGSVSRAPVTTGTGAAGPSRTPSPAETGSAAAGPAARTGGRAAGEASVSAAPAPPGGSLIVDAIVRTRRVPRPVLECVCCACTATLPDPLAGDAVGPWAAKGLAASAATAMANPRMLLGSAARLGPVQGLCAAWLGCVCGCGGSSRRGETAGGVLTRDATLLQSTMRALHAGVTGSTGMALASTAVMVWVVSFPSALALVPALWVWLESLCMHRGRNFAKPSGLLAAVTLWHCLSLVAFAVSCVFAAFAAPEPFVLASRNDDAPAPLGSAAVYALYGPAARVLGLVPGQFAALRVLLGLLVAAVLAIYHKTTVAPAQDEGAARETSLAGRAPLLEAMLTVRAQARIALSRAAAQPRSTATSVLATPGRAEAADAAAAAAAAPMAAPRASVDDAPAAASDDRAIECAAAAVAAALSDQAGRHAAAEGPALDDETHDLYCFPAGTRSTGTARSVIAQGTRTSEWRPLEAAKRVRLPCVMGFVVWSRWMLWAAAVWARSQSHWLALVALYVLSLFHVDLLAAGYLLFFVVFFVNPRVRQQYWRFLVIYSVLSIATLVIWWVMALEDAAAATAIPAWVLGLSPPPQSPPPLASLAPSLWSSVAVPTNLVIFLLSAAQLPVYLEAEAQAACSTGCVRSASSRPPSQQARSAASRASPAGGAAAAIASYELGRWSALPALALTKFPWAARVADWAASVWLRHGIWVCFGLYLVLPLLRPTVMGLTTLVVLLIILGRHLVAMGLASITSPVATSSRHRMHRNRDELKRSQTRFGLPSKSGEALAQADELAARQLTSLGVLAPLRLMAVLQAVFFAVRYAYQFELLQQWFDAFWASIGGASLVAPHELGLERYADASGNISGESSLYISLLDTVVLLLVSMMLLGAIRNAAAKAAAKRKQLRVERRRLAELEAQMRRDESRRLTEAEGDARLSVNRLDVVASAGSAESVRVTIPVSSSPKHPRGTVVGSAGAHDTVTIDGSVTDSDLLFAVPVLIEPYHDTSADVRGLADSQDDDDWDEEEEEEEDMLGVDAGAKPAGTAAIASGSTSDSDGEARDGHGSLQQPVWRQQAALATSHVRLGIWLLAERQVDALGSDIDAGAWCGLGGDTSDARAFARRRGELRLWSRASALSGGRVSALPLLVQTPAAGSAGGIVRGTATVRELDVDVAPAVCCYGCCTGRVDPRALVDDDGDSDGDDASKDGSNTARRIRAMSSLTEGGSHSPTTAAAAGAVPAASAAESAIGGSAAPGVATSRADRRRSSGRPPLSPDRELWLRSLQRQAVGQRLRAGEVGFICCRGRCALVLCGPAGGSSTAPAAKIETPLPPHVSVMAALARRRLRAGQQGRPVPSIAAIPPRLTGPTAAAEEPAEASSGCCVARWGRAEVQTESIVTADWEADGSGGKPQLRVRSRFTVHIHGLAGTQGPGNSRKDASGSRVPLSSGGACDACSGIESTLFHHGGKLTLVVAAVAAVSQGSAAGFVLLMACLALLVAYVQRESTETDSVGSSWFARVLDCSICCCCCCCGAGASPDGRSGAADYAIVSGGGAPTRRGLGAEESTRRSPDRAAALARRRHKSRGGGAGANRGWCCGICSSRAANLAAFDVADSSATEDDADTFGTSTRSATGPMTNNRRPSAFSRASMSLAKSSLPIAGGRAAVLQSGARAGDLAAMHAAAALSMLRPGGGDTVGWWQGAGVLDIDEEEEDAAARAGVTGSATAEPDDGSSIDGFNTGGKTPGRGMGEAGATNPLARIVQLMSPSALAASDYAAVGSSESSDAQSRRSSGSDGVMEGADPPAFGGAATLVGASRGTPPRLAGETHRPPSVPHIPLTAAVSSGFTRCSMRGVAARDVPQVVGAGAASASAAGIGPGSTTSPSLRRKADLSVGGASQANSFGTRGSSAAGTASIAWSAAVVERRSASLSDLLPSAPFSALAVFRAGFTHAAAKLAVHRLRAARAAKDQQLLRNRLAEKAGSRPADHMEGGNQSSSKDAANAAEDAAVPETFFNTSLSAREMPRRPFRDVWAWMFLLAWLLLLMKYCTQFRVFAAAAASQSSSLDARWAGFWVVNTTINASLPLSGTPLWAPPTATSSNGISPSGYSYTSIFSGMWALLGPEVAIIVAAALQRWAHSLDRRDRQRQRRKLAHLHRTGVLAALAADTGSLDARVEMDSTISDALSVLECLGTRVLLAAGFKAPPRSAHGDAAAAAACAALQPATGRRSSAGPRSVQSEIVFDAESTRTGDQWSFAGGGRALLPGVLLRPDAAAVAAAKALEEAGGGYSSIIDRSLQASKAVSSSRLLAGSASGLQLKLTRGAALQSAANRAVARLAQGGAALQAALAAVRFLEAGAPLPLAVYAAACGVAESRGHELPPPPTDTLRWSSPAEAEAVALCLAVEAPSSSFAQLLRVAAGRMSSRHILATQSSTNGAAGVAGAGAGSAAGANAGAGSGVSPGRPRVASALAPILFAVEHASATDIDARPRTPSGVDVDPSTSSAAGSSAARPASAISVSPSSAAASRRAALGVRKRLEAASARFRVLHENVVRPLVPAFSAVGKTLEYHRARICMCLTSILLLCSALLWVNVWSVPLIAYSVVAAVIASFRRSPAAIVANVPERLRRAALSEADSTGAVVTLLEAATSHSSCTEAVLWGIVVLALAVQTLAQYLLVLGWPPAVWAMSTGTGEPFPATIWPWSQAESLRAWVGLPSQGREALWLLLPQFAALLLGTLARRFAKSRQRAAMLLLASRDVTNSLQMAAERVAARATPATKPGVGHARSSMAPDPRVAGDIRQPALSAGRVEEEAKALATLAEAVASAAAQRHRFKQGLRASKVSQYMHLVSEAIDVAEQGGDLVLLPTARLESAGRNPGRGTSSTSAPASASDEVINVLEGARVAAGSQDAFAAVVAQWSSVALCVVLLAVALLDGAQDLQTASIVGIMLWMLLRADRPPPAALGTRSSSATAMHESKALGRRAHLGSASVANASQRQDSTRSIQGSGAPQGSAGGPSATPGPLADQLRPSDVGRMQPFTAIAPVAGARSHTVHADQPGFCTCFPCCGQRGSAASASSTMNAADSGATCCGAGLCGDNSQPSDREWTQRPWRVLLVVALALLFVQVLYQMPFLPSPRPCALTATCSTWQGVIGLHKVTLPGFAVSGAPACSVATSGGLLENSTVPSSNSDCPSPFQTEGGGLGLLFLAVIASIWQMALLDSTLSRSVRVANARDDERATLRGWVWLQHERYRRRTQTAAFRREMLGLRRRLRALVRRVVRWRAMLDGAKSAGRISDASSSWPPAAPRRVRAVLSPSGDVVVAWDPPFGYTKDPTAWVAEGVDGFGDDDEVAGPSRIGGRRRLSMESLESGSVAAFGAVQMRPATELRYDVSWQTRGSQLFPQSVAPRTRPGCHAVVLRGVPIGRQVTVSVRAINGAGAGAFTEPGCSVQGREWLSVVGEAVVETASLARRQAAHHGLDCEAAAWRAAAVRLFGSARLGRLLTKQAQLIQLGQGDVVCLQPTSGGFLRGELNAVANIDGLDDVLFEGEHAWPAADDLTMLGGRSLAVVAGELSLPVTQPDMASTAGGGSADVGTAADDSSTMGWLPAAAADAVELKLTGGALVSPHEASTILSAASKAHKDGKAALEEAEAAAASPASADQSWWHRVMVWLPCCACCTRASATDGDAQDGPERQASAGSPVGGGGEASMHSREARHSSPALARHPDPTGRSESVNSGSRARDGSESEHVHASEANVHRFGKAETQTIAAEAMREDLRTSGDSFTGRFVNAVAGAVDRTVIPRPIAGFVAVLIATEDMLLGVGLRLCGGRHVSEQRARLAPGQRSCCDCCRAAHSPTAGEKASSVGLAGTAPGPPQGDAMQEAREETSSRPSLPLRNLLASRAAAAQAFASSGGVTGIAKAAGTGRQREQAAAELKQFAVTAAEALVLLPWWARPALAVHLVVLATLSHTQLLVLVVAVAALLNDASIIASVPVIALVTTILPRYPRAPAAAWSMLTLWMVLVVLLKHLLQIPLFCTLVDTSSRHLFWAAGGACTGSDIPTDPDAPLASATAVAAAAQLVQPLDLLGLTKFSVDLGGQGFFAGIAWDGALLLCLLLHRFTLRSKGAWPSNGVIGVSALRAFTGDAGDISQTHAAAVADLSTATRPDAVLGLGFDGEGANTVSPTLSPGSELPHAVGTVSFHPRHSSAPNLEGVPSQGRFGSLEAIAEDATATDEGDRLGWTRTHASTGVAGSVASPLGQPVAGSESPAHGDSDGDDDAVLTGLGVPNSPLGRVASSSLREEIEQSGARARAASDVESQIAASLTATDSRDEVPGTERDLASRSRLQAPPSLPMAYGGSTAGISTLHATATPAQLGAVVAVLPRGEDDADSKRGARPRDIARLKQGVVRRLFEDEVQGRAEKGLPEAFASDMWLVRWAALSISRDEVATRWALQLEAEMVAAQATAGATSQDDALVLAAQELLQRHAATHRPTNAGHGSQRGSPPAATISREARRDVSERNPPVARSQSAGDVDTTTVSAPAFLAAALAAAGSADSKPAEPEATGGGSPSAASERLAGDSAVLEAVPEVLTANSLSCSGCLRTSAASAVLSIYDTVRGVSDREYQGLNSRQPDKPGHDLYLWSAVVQMVLILFSAFFYGVMTGSGAGLQQELQYNQFSGGMVLVLVGQVILMAVDRLSYLYRSSALKAVIQLILAIVIHISVFYVVPSDNQRRFGSQNVALVVYYCLWLVFLLLGSAQLYFGFSRTPPKDSLKSSGFSCTRLTLFNMFASIPFLLELKAILDWTATRTSLDVWMWVKLESIHNDLFRVQCNMEYRDNDRVVLSGKKPQGWLAKLTSGWLYAVLILIFIITPMLVFSTLNPVLQDNPVNGLTATVRIEGEGRTFIVYQSTQPQSIEAAVNISSSWFVELQSNATDQNAAQTGATSTAALRSPVESDWLPQTQRVISFPFSDRRWTIAPPALDSLVDLLQRASAHVLDGGQARLGGGARAEAVEVGATGSVRSAHATKARHLQAAATPPLVSISLEASFVRDGPPTAKTATTVSRAPLTPGQALLVHDALVAAANASSLPTAISSMGTPRASTAVGEPLIVNGLFPYILRLPATTDVTPVGTRKRSLLLRLHVGDNVAAAMVGRRSLSHRQGPCSASEGECNWDDWQRRMHPVARKLVAATASLPPTVLPLWWTANIAPDDPFGRAVPGGGIEFVTVSDRVAPDILVQSLGGSSILAVYTLILVTVGGLFRALFVVPTERVMYTELEDCRYLLELCEAIHIAEADSSFARHLENEMYLYDTLIGFYKSPEILSRITRKRQHD